MRNFKLFELDHNPTRFVAAKESISNFEEHYLRELGDRMRRHLKDSQYFWRDGAFCWYTDSTQGRWQKIYLLESGACIFEDFTINSGGKAKYYNVVFDY